MAEFSCPIRSLDERVAVQLARSPYAPHALRGATGLEQPWICSWTATAAAAAAAAVTRKAASTFRPRCSARPLANRQRPRAQSLRRARLDVKGRARRREVHRNRRRTQGRTRRTTRRMRCLRRSRGCSTRGTSPRARRSFARARTTSRASSSPAAAPSSPSDCLRSSSRPSFSAALRPQLRSSASLSLPSSVRPKASFPIRARRLPSRATTSAWPGQDPERPSATSSRSSASSGPTRTGSARED